MHTYIYKHSELPAFRPEQKAEIIALGLHADDLILKSQGNYRELEELAETLNNSLNICELNLGAIRIIPDDSTSPEPAAVSFQDLSIEEKQLIFECSRTNSILLNVLSEITGESCEKLARDIATQAIAHQKPVERSEIEKFIDDVMMPLAKQVKENPPQKGLYVFKQL